MIKAILKKDAVIPDNLAEMTLHHGAEGQEAYYKLVDLLCKNKGSYPKNWAHVCDYLNEGRTVGFTQMQAQSMIENYGLFYVTVKEFHLKPLKGFIWFVHENGKNRKTDNNG